MLSLLLVAGAASGEFLTPIKSHHHQESLNLKESSHLNPKKAFLDKFVQNGSFDAKGAHGPDCANCKAGDKGCQDCKGHNDFHEKVMGQVKQKMLAIVVEQQNARAKIGENQKELTALQGQQATDKAWSDDRSAKLKATRGVTKAAAALMKMKNASSSTETSQASSSSMGAHAFPSAASQPVRESVFAYAPPAQNQGYQGSYESSSRGSMFSAPGVSQPAVIYTGPGSTREHGGFPIQHQVNQGSRGGSHDLSSRSTSTGRFGAGSRSSTVTSGAYDSGSTGGFGSGGKPDCPLDVRVPYECLCKTSTNNGVVNTCYEGQTCTITGYCS